MYRFQEHQEAARQTTIQLCLALGLAILMTLVVSTLASGILAAGCSRIYLDMIVKMDFPEDMLWNWCVTRTTEAGAVMLLAFTTATAYTAWKLHQQGNCYLAKKLGGQRISAQDTDQRYRQVSNIIAEMSIASSLPVPQVYVLPFENSINAFAIGHAQRDPVIGLTQGAIEQLNRDQLQAVVAHEFSHLANGDARLNTRILSFLSGIQVISTFAAYLWRTGLGGKRSAPSGRATSSVGFSNPLGQLLALIFAVVLWPIGQVGLLAARLVQLAVNRQREFLADASAVQYTRNAAPLREVLELLRDDARGSAVSNPTSALTCHMFFADARPSERIFDFSDLFRTHPRLEERIRRLQTL